MKFYLSSYKFGDNPKLLAGLFGENKKIAIIPNALDVYTDLARRKTGLLQEKSGLEDLGLIPDELDLRRYFKNPTKLPSELEKYGGVWVLGGNTFTLRRAYKQTGFDAWLRANRSNVNFVYAGYSAGVCVLSPNLRGLETIDKSDLVPESYDSEVIWEGVGVIDFAIAPHYKSDHPESILVDELVQYYEKHHITFKILHDGEVYISEIKR